LKNIPNAIWITWESQRRSIELAKSFGAKLFVLQDIGFRPIRYLYLSLKTTLVVFEEKPRTIFAQNPSMILATLLCLIKKIFNFKLVVDRHSNFKFHKNQKLLKWRIFNFLSKFTVKHADLTIVTNEYLKKFVNSLGGNGYVLQDKIPELPFGERIKLEGEKNIVFISSFSEDEPIEQVINIANLINNKWFVYITGNYKKYKGKKLNLNKLPNNLKLTGFLSEKDYQSLLISSDCIIILTKQEYTLTCGAYESVALNKPFVATDSKAIKDYFKRGVVYSKSESHSIANAVQTVIANVDVLEKDIILLKKDLISDWNKRFYKLYQILS